MTNKLLMILAIAAFSVVGGYFAYDYVVENGAEKPFILKPDESSIVSAGRIVYMDNCASCHGENLEGQPNWRQRTPSGRLPAPPHDETGHTWHHADKALFDLTKFGPQFVAGPDYQSDMPAFDGILSDDEIVATLSYIKSTWNTRERETQDEITRRSVIQ